MKNNEKREVFNSWKEIAQYLGRDIRTCWRWEKLHGLPVYRVDPDSPKSRVYAFKDELEEWLRKGNHIQLVRKKGTLSWPPWKWFLFIGLPGLVALVAALFLIRPHLLEPTKPADFHIEGSTLIILNDTGKKLWDYDTNLPNLVDEIAYRDHFQFRRFNESQGRHLLPNLMLKDINADGRIEVLFSTQTQDEFREGELICFNHRGKELWRFKAGREIRFGSTLYNNDYRIHGFDTCDINNDGQLEIFVSCLHMPNWPTQIVSLSPQGKLLGEYWHSGHLGDMVFKDFDNDGRIEIILTGLNNEYARGCLVVFEASNLKGSSPQIKDEFRCFELGPGSEEFYILFPRTDYDIITYPVESIYRTDILASGQLLLTTAISKIIFVLNPDLTVNNIIFSHGFILFHDEAVRAGKLKSTLDEKYRENLFKGVLYYDGQGWVNIRTPIHR